MEFIDIIKNTKKLYISTSALDTLLDFERVLDALDMYAFANWEDGEIVEGPLYSRYWIECTFMWPRHMMPDPSGAERLLDYDCKITYNKSSIKKAKKIVDPGDFRPGTKKPKLIDIPIWLVTIRMPRNLINTFEQAALDLEGEMIDAQDMQDVYEKDIDETSVEGESPGGEAAAAPAAPELGAI